MWQHAEDLAKTVAAGGRVGVGSHGQLQGLGMHWELWLVQSGGLSEHDALRAATIVGAEAIGLGTERRLARARASWPTCSCSTRDPLVNIRNTNTISDGDGERAAVRREHARRGVSAAADAGAAAVGV